MTLPNAAALSSYLGAPMLTDFSPVVDPNTDVSAVGFNQLANDTAMMSRMVPRAVVTYAYDGTSANLIAQDAVWGNNGALVINRTGTGLFTVGFPFEIVDQLGNIVLTNIRFVLSAQVMSTTGFYFCTGTIASSSTVNLRIASSSGAADDALNQPVSLVVL
jgi:hypothetical protein